MDEQRAQRTLVKSPPELWAEISDVEALARHLGEFGEISITRSEPETAVAWEGDRARGTVELEPAGWGTRVTLTAVPVGRLAAAAEPVGAEPQAAAPIAPAPEPAAQQPPAREPAAPEPAGPESEPRPGGEAAVDADDAPQAAPEADAAVTRRGLWARFVAFWRGPQEEEQAREPATQGDGAPATTDDGAPATTDDGPLVATDDEPPAAIEGPSRAPRPRPRPPGRRRRRRSRSPPRPRRRPSRPPPAPRTPRAPPPSSSRSSTTSARRGTARSPG